jgi:hypothetical protein
MDSGAFSAHNSGTVIKLQDYIDTCKRFLATDPTLTEVFALDVINDWEASLRNTQEMWRQGVPAIPTYHSGEPREALVEMARLYPKIALGGAVGLRLSTKNAWAEKCFALVYPKKIHGLGFGARESVERLPFHSVDATNWEMSTCGFGKWQAFGNSQLSIKGSKQNLKAEINYFLEVEAKARGVWKKEMARIKGEDGPIVRLAVVSSGRELLSFPARKPVTADV